MRLTFWNERSSSRKSRQARMPVLLTSCFSGSMGRTPRSPAGLFAAVSRMFSKPMQPARGQDENRRLRPINLALLLSLACWPVAAAVPTPSSYFTHEIGEDRKVLDWDQVVSYFRLLEASSPRIKVQELGKTTEGRPLIAATI